MCNKWPNEPHAAECLPKGETTIAPCFNMGYADPTMKSPEGTVDKAVIKHLPFSRPFGTYFLRTLVPNLERLGYSRSSLRDERRHPGGIEQECPRSSLWAVTILGLLSPALSSKGGEGDEIIKGLAVQRAWFLK